jgi:hypothetical protein
MIIQLPKTLFRNLVTGETMDSDPRMLPEPLEAKGIELKWFRLV